MKFLEKIKLINVSITTKCNFSCEYCYKLNILNSKPDMKIETIDKIVDSFTCKEKPSIIFFGGEPMLNQNLIIEAIQKYGTKIHWQVITNGSIKMDKLINEIKNIPNIVDDLLFIISYDGTKIDVRGNKCGGTDYKTLEYNKNLLFNNGFRVHMNPTFCHSNINNMSMLYDEARKDWFIYHNQVTYGLNFAKQYELNNNERFIYLNNIQHNMKYILNQVGIDMKNSNNPYIPRYITALSHITIFNKQINTQCNNEFRYSIDVEGNIFRCNICSTDIKNSVGQITDKEVKPNYIYHIPSNLITADNEITNFNKKLNCGLKCTIDPMIFSILQTEIRLFCIKNDINPSHNFWCKFNYDKDLYDADYSLGSITDSEAFDKII